LKLGLEVFFERELYKKYKKAKIALLTHQGALDQNLRLSYELFYKHFGERLHFLFSPQHGLFSEKQANMIASPDEREPFFGLQVISLYGERLKPEPEDLKKVDVIFVDLQEVGCRVYTYIWTLFLLLREATFYQKKVVVLDRPNPLGDFIEGPILEKDYLSFVGLDPLPQRHGLTLGELALLFQKRHFNTLSLKVISMENYHPQKLLPFYKRPWIFPSPNLPNFESALLYPGMVYLEGTNLSEGRGTTLPFLIFGAPYLRLKETYELLKVHFPEKEFNLRFRPLAFEPTFDKWKGKRCYGFQIFIKDPYKVKPVSFALKLIKILKETHEDFAFLPPPYEFEREKKPIEILVGNKRILEWLFEGHANFTLPLPEEELKPFYDEVSSLRIYS